MKKLTTKYKYEISYFDPSDETGERWKTWKFKTLREAKNLQFDLKTAWKSPAREFPIKKLKFRIVSKKSRKKKSPFANLEKELRF